MVLLMVVVVGRHSGATGSPRSLLQLITRWEPSLVDTALMALRLISLLRTSTCLVFLTVTELGTILRKMQSRMMTRLELSTTTLEDGRWLKVDDSIRKNLTLLMPIYK